MKEGRPSWTARWVATQRVELHESRPAAGDVAGELRFYKDLAIPVLGLHLAGPTGMGKRTEFIDRQLVQAVDRGVGQVAIIGAGYDGRFVRFSDLPVRWFEVDHPATQTDKLSRLARLGISTRNVSFVGADLSDCELDSDLNRVGHDPEQPCLWICEGLFPYLTKPVIRQLCGRLRRRSSPRSVLVGNVLVADKPTQMTRLVRRGVDHLLESIGERRLSEFKPGEIEALLTDTGWQPESSESTSPGRADGSYLLAFTAVPA